VAAGAVYALVIRDPLGGKALYVHRADPAFNLLYNPRLVERVDPRAGELLRLRAHRGRLFAAATVERLRLPSYRGDVAGLLPVLAENRARRLAAELESLRLTADGRARVRTAPGYLLAYRFGSRRRPREGIDLVLVAPDEPGTRDAVLLRFRLVKPAGRQPRRRRLAARATRSALRSFEFGSDRF